MSTLTATPISVRHAREEDRPLLEQMYAAFPPQDIALGLPPREPDRLRTWLASLQLGINLVATVEETMAGHLVLMPKGHSAEMALFVHPEFRRQGIATELARAAMEVGRASGLRFLWVLISSANCAARVGLVKFGFHTAWEGLGEVQMVYRL